MELLIDAFFTVLTILLTRYYPLPHDSYGRSGTSLSVLKETLSRVEYGVTDAYDYEINFIKPIVAKLFLALPMLIDYHVYVFIPLVVAGKRLLLSISKSQHDRTRACGSLLFYMNPYLYDMILYGRVHVIEFVLTSLWLYSLYHVRNKWLHSVLFAFLVYINYCNVLLLIIYQSVTTLPLKARVPVVIAFMSLLCAASYYLEGSWVTLKEIFNNKHHRVPQGADIHELRRPRQRDLLQHFRRL